MGSAEEERRAAERRDTDRRLAKDPKYAGPDRRKGERREHPRRET